MAELNAVIAIASHERPQILQCKTLKLLKRHKIPMNQVYVFVSPQSHSTYKEIEKNWGFQLVGGKNTTILKTRNNIIKYFDEGQNIVEMDDDDAVLEARDVVILDDDIIGQMLVPELKVRLNRRFANATQAAE